MLNPIAMMKYVDWLKLLLNLTQKFPKFLLVGFNAYLPLPASKAS